MDEPTIKVFMQGGQPSGVYIVGDSVSTRISGRRIGFRMLLLLVCMYRAYKIPIPKQMTSLLVLDHFMFDSTIHPSSTKAVLFLLKDMKEERSRLTV
jgi:hypothetical protein